MSVRFDDPLWLTLALLAVPLGVIGMAWLRGMSPLRRWIAVLTRAALLLIIAALFAGATLRHETDRFAVIGIVDASASVTRSFLPPPREDGTRPTLSQYVGSVLAAGASGKRPDDFFGVVSFGSRPSVSVPLETSPPESDIPLIAEVREATDISAALTLAHAMVPPGTRARFVLFSDGLETTGDAIAAAGQAQSGQAAGGASSSIPIDVVALNYELTNAVVVEQLDAPPTAPASTTITLRVVLNAAGPALGTLRVLHEGEAVAINQDEPRFSRRLSLPKGRTVHSVVIKMPPGRVHRFEAIWEDDQGDADSSDSAAGTRALTPAHRAEACTVSPGGGSTLIVDGVSGGDPSGGGATLGRTLAQAGIVCKTIPPEALGDSLLWLQEFDLVILQNVPAEAVTRRAQDALAAYVRDLAGGLMMVGGPDSFGAGGWKGSAIEPLLPVLLDLPQRLMVPAAAVVLVIDNSGSMNRYVLGADQSQQAVANEGAAITIESMDATDLVGVISFNSDYTIEWPLSPNATPKVAAARVRSISPDGGTNLPPALRAAYDALRGVRAEVRHVIVLSDGVSQGKERLPRLAADMAREGIQISTIAVGDAADTDMMATLAREGGGKFYRVVDPLTLPRMFLKAMRVVRTPLVRETPFVPVLLPTGSPVVEGIVGQIPPLGGLTLTQRRPEAKVVTPLATPEGEPLLAYWGVGLGRIGVFTSDTHRWAKDWLDWPGYSRLWTQIVRALQRSPMDRSQALTTRFEGDELIVRLEATDSGGRPLNDLRVPGTLYAPNGARTALRLAQVGPGVYEGRTPASAMGTSVLVVSPIVSGGARVGGGDGGGASPLPPLIAGVSRGTALELRSFRSNPELLRQVAAVSGGRVIDPSGKASLNFFDRTGTRPALAQTPVWRVLTIWLIVVMLLDVAMRRLAWDRWISPELLSSFRPSARRSVLTTGHLAETRRERSIASGGAATGPVREHEGQVTLTESDAADIVRQGTKRRRFAAGQGSANSQMPVDSAPDTAEEIPSPEQRPTNVPADGLAAAKRRARKRMDDAS